LINLNASHGKVKSIILVNVLAGLNEQLEGTFSQTLINMNRFVQNGSSFGNFLHACYEFGKGFDFQIIIEYVEVVKVDLLNSRIFKKAFDYIAE
jgi:hypothetical protein